MQERGRLQEGKVADITIFDPENVTDNATYKAGEQGLPTTGIPYVIVSGVPVVRDSEFQLDVRPGKSIRFPVEEKGRFKPISVENYDQQFTIQGFSVDGGSMNPGNAAELLAQEDNNDMSSGTTVKVSGPVLRTVAHRITCGIRPRSGRVPSARRPMQPA